MKLILPISLLTLTTFAVAGEPQFKPIELPQPPLQTELIDALDEAIEQAGDEPKAGLFKKRARQFAYGGEWEKAAADFRRAAELDHDSKTWTLAGVTLLLADQRMAYEQVVEDFFKQHAENENMYSREKRAKMCVLPRKPIGKEETVEVLAAQSIAQSKGKRRASCFTVTLPLIYYRYGNYDAAHKAIADTDRRNVLQKKIAQDVYAINRLIEAMCHAKQGDLDKASASFAKADTTLRARLMNVNLVFNSIYWHYWIMARLLHDEACDVLADARTKSAAKDSPTNDKKQSAERDLQRGNP